MHELLDIVAKGSEEKNKRVGRFKTRPSTYHNSKKLVYMKKIISKLTFVFECFLNLNLRARKKVFQLHLLHPTLQSINLNLLSNLKNDLSRV
jgi:hypothetical protein